MRQHTNHTTSAPGSAETWTSTKAPPADVVARALDPATFAADGRPIEASGKRVIERLLRPDGSVSQEIVVETTTLTVMRSAPQRTKVQGRPAPVECPWPDAATETPAAMAVDRFRAGFPIPGWLLVMIVAALMGMGSRWATGSIAAGAGTAFVVGLVGLLWAGSSSLLDPSSDPSPLARR